jgi:hypothetical protein
MPQLYLHNREIETIFQLLGEKENDLTYSIGWALYRSPHFLGKFLKSLVKYSGHVEKVVVRLQHHKDASGVTDIELELPGQFHIVIEAKRGWSLPSSSQLRKYARRLRASPAKTKRLVVLSECSPEYAAQILKRNRVHGIPLATLRWKSIAHLADKASRNGSHAEKRLIQELLSYLNRSVVMQQIDSNKVYVLSLAKGTQRGWRISWIDIVRRKRRYFHPLDPNWPKDPPNYIAFRYGGRLQSVHHIDSYKVVTRLHHDIPEIPNDEWNPMYLYTLGPPFAPAKVVRNGNIYPSGRVWCMLDTLFTCKTISEARDLSKKRELRPA